MTDAQSLTYAMRILKSLHDICAAKPTISNEKVEGGYIPEGSRLFVLEDEDSLETVYHNIGALDDVANELKSSCLRFYGQMEFKVVNGHMLEVIMPNLHHAIEVDFVEGTYYGIKYDNNGDPGVGISYCAIGDLQDWGSAE